MAFGVTNEFQEMKVGMGLGLAPQPQHPLEIKATAENTAAPQKVEVEGVKKASNANVVDNAAITGGNLRNDYKGPEATPKGDISYGANVLGKATIELFGALRDKSEEPAIEAPENQQLAMAAPQQKYVAPFGL